MVLLRLLVIVLYVGVVLELVCGLAPYILYPRCELRIRIADGNHEEDARTEHVVEVVCHESGDELVLLFRQLHSLLMQFSVHNLHVAAVHYGTVVSVEQLCLLVLQLVIAVEELEEFVVKRRSANSLLRVVQLYSDVALLYNDGNDALVVHKDVRHAYGVVCSAELELSVNDVARIDVLEVIILQNLKIQHSSVKCRHI